MKRTSEYGARFLKKWKVRKETDITTKRDAQYWYAVGWKEKQSFDDSRAAKKKATQAKGD